MNYISYSGVEILIVEDNYLNYILLKEQLTRFDIQHFWAKNGLEAVEMVEYNKNIALILMDINMPVMDGITATRNIRKLGFSNPVVFQTAYDNEVNRKECSLAGGDDFLNKPISLDMLSFIFNKYLTKKSSI